MIRGSLLQHGQAAGTAAAYAVQCGMTPQQVAENADAVWSIQQVRLNSIAYSVLVIVTILAATLA